MRKKQIIIFFAVFFVVAAAGIVLLLADAYREATDYRGMCEQNLDKHKTVLTVIAEETLELGNDNSSNAINLLPEESRKNLNDRSIYHVGVQGGDKVYFTVKTTGLFDGGVEYGIYYSDNADCKLNLSMSVNDFMKIERLGGNWFYYEWHNG